MQRFEYAMFHFEGPSMGDQRWVRTTSSGEDIEKIKGDEFIYTLGYLGDQGWELVLQDPSATKGRLLVFKRTVDE